MLRKEKLERGKEKVDKGIYMKFVISLGTVSNPLD